MKHPILLAKDQAKIDLIAAEQHGLSIETLMERAGWAAFEELRRRGWGPKIGILCGPGNNGGDGLALALRAASEGWAPHVFVSSQTRSTGHPEFLLKQVSADGIPVKDLTPALDDFGADAWVDALFGVGLARPPEGEFAQAIEFLNQQAAPVLALDIPSGLSADDGNPMGDCVRAQATLAYCAPKRGFFQSEGQSAVGPWRCETLGIPEALINVPDRDWCYDLSSIRTLVPRYGRRVHKGDRGKVLIIAGSADMPGAACLCARGALRTGAGLVRVASHANSLSALASSLPEALHLHVGPHSGVEELREAIAWASSIVIGPGLGRSENAQAMICQVLSLSDKPTLVDADALFAMGGMDRFGPGPFALTPHDGEAARLIESDPDTVRTRRFDSASKISARFGAATLLKGPDTLITAAQAPTWVCRHGHAGMASGGMGDVLSGIVGALLAQDLTPMDALIVGAALHGRAAEKLSSRGPIGYLAHEVADMIPSVLAEL